jgi:hypothetical protein
MRKAEMTCHGCGDKGHFESECPNKGIDATGKPPWCGFCDERTRTIDHGESASRCQICHPQRHKQLRQHRKCPSCHMTVYEWDNAPCGSHSGPTAPDRRPERETIERVIRTEMENA